MRPSAELLVDALMSAAREGNQKLVEQLLDIGVDVSVVSDFGYTALHHAVWGGHAQLVDFLLAKGADPNIIVPDNYTMSALHVAVREQNPALAQRLIQAHADVNARDVAGMTPLHLAVSVPNNPVLPVLLASRPRVNEPDFDGGTPLHRAAELNVDVVVFEALIAAGADVNARNRAQETPLHITARESYLDAAEVLIRERADVNARDLIQATPLHYAAMADSVPIARALLMQGADRDAMDHKGNTPLHRSVVREKVGCDVADDLLKAGANPLVKNLKGKFARDLAAKGGDLRRQINETMRWHRSHSPTITATGASPSGTP